MKPETGNYTCRAENVCGSVTCTASVSILTDWEITEDLTAPHFIVKPQTAKVMDGQPLTFMSQVRTIYFRFKTTVRLSDSCLDAELMRWHWFFST